MRNDVSTYNMANVLVNSQEITQNYSRSNFKNRWKFQYLLYPKSEEVCSWSNEQITKFNAGKFAFVGNYVRLIIFHVYPYKTFDIPYEVAMS